MPCASAVAFGCLPWASQVVTCREGHAGRFACLGATFSLLRRPEPGRAGRMRGWLHGADEAATPSGRLAPAHRVLFQRGVGLGFIRCLFPSLLTLKRGGGRGGGVALCVAKTQAEGDSLPLPPECRALVAGSLVAAGLGSSASGRHSWRPRCRAGGLGSSWVGGARSSLCRTLVPWLPGAAQGGPGDLSSRSLTRFPPGADLGPVVTLLYVTNVSPACLPIWLCILKC